MIRVYLDNCCFSRLFDNQKEERVRLETAAIRLILQRVLRGDPTMIGSDAVNAEVAAIRNPDLRRGTQLLTSATAEHIHFDPSLIRRGEVLKLMGFRGYDSLHIACAEAAGADILLTTDDAFVRRARRLQHESSVRVANPLTWLNGGPE